jgi:hypothetical protein
MLANSLIFADFAPEEPRIHPTLPWVAAQLLPSPELTLAEEPGFGMRWQVTPLSYSFGLHRSLSPWRSFVVEPLARQSGSIELCVSPEYLSALDEEFGMRFGIRSYFPLVERGEYLSFSIGSSYLRFGSEGGQAWEAGLYVLSGFVGIEVAYAPALDPARFILALKVRPF